MEETLGKRIMTNRKRLGLTQDRLAELLGVTAQAVSKWENDLSCPDITILPRLAEIFNISTDELLGRAAPARVVIPEEKEEPRNCAPWVWNGRIDALALAVMVLLVGALMLTSRLLQWNVSFWSILWPSAILMLGVRGLIGKFSCFSVGCVLFGGYFLLDNLNVINLDISGELVLPILILFFGVSLLVDTLRKPRHSHKHCHIHGNGVNTKNQFSTEGERFLCSMAFGENTRHITMPRLSFGEISCSFGDLTVDFCGCEEFAENCCIRADCSFGELTLQIPRHIRIESESSTAFASLDIHGHPDPEPKGCIQLNAKVCFGQIIIRYI